MAYVLQILKKEEEEQKKEQHALEEENKQKEEDRLKCEEEENKQKEEDRLKCEEEEHKLAEEQEWLRKELEQNKDEQTGTENDNSKLNSILEWVKEQHVIQKEQQNASKKLKELQDQIEAMAKPDNRQPCQSTGVNFFANLEALQGEGGGRIDLAAKAQAAMQAPNNAKRKVEGEQDSDGEFENSTYSHVKVKKQKLVSDLAQKSGHKVKYEVEWAHH